MKHLLALFAAALTLYGAGAAAQGGTTPPQSPGVIEIDLGQSVFIDPVFAGVQGPCWYTTNAGPAIPNQVEGSLASSGTRAVIPNYTPATWLSWRSNPGILQHKVCCRPKPIQLCREGGATPVTVTLPYTPYGLSQTPAQRCIDQWGEPYDDSQTWVCGQTGSGVDSDGEWAEVGTDTLGCSPNAFTSACSASCPTTTGTTTTYDSCGNVQQVNSCAISCCTPAYSYSCQGSAYIGTDTSCGTGSFNAGTCTLTQSSGTWGCDLSYGDSYTCGNGTVDYYQCNSAWYCEAGDCSGTCTPNPPAGAFPAIVTGNCAPGYTYPVNSAHCSGSYWAPP